MSDTEKMLLATKDFFTVTEQMLTDNKMVLESIENKLGNIKHAMEIDKNETIYVGNNVISLEKYKRIKKEVMKNIYKELTYGKVAYNIRPLNVIEINLFVLKKEEKIDNAINAIISDYLFTIQQEEFVKESKKDHLGELWLTQREIIEYYLVKFKVY
jgi:hypothetical protein